MPKPPTCSLYEVLIPGSGVTNPYLLTDLKKTLIYNFKFTVYNTCIIYRTWYPHDIDS
jgi:hypothetical protein